MEKLLKNKYHKLSVLLIFGLFLLSVQLRQDKLNAELSPTDEWITAHTLMTLDIWDQAGGPQAYGFNPIYTYEGEGNKRISSLGGIMDSEGRMYYTSYPPFAFIGAYYFTKLLGGPDVGSLRAFGLVTHFFCALLIYLIIRKLRPKSEKDTIAIGAITGAVLYLFSSGTLWMHGIMYFSDTLVQLFIILSIYLLVRLVKEDYKHPNSLLGLIAFITFLGVYTEWLALFFAFVSGIALLILYFVQKKPLFLKAFLVIGCSAALSLTLTVTQYSSIDGFDTYYEVSKSKYDHRSGRFDSTEGGQNFNWENPASFELMETNINRNWAMAINMFPIIFILLVPFLFWNKARKEMKAIRWKLFITIILLLSILMHYFLFFNFNAIHNFSNLKTGFFMVLVIGLVTSVITASIKWHYRAAFTAVLLYFILTRSHRDYLRFENFYHPETFVVSRDASAEIVKQYNEPAVPVFTNLFVTPEYMYKAKRNVFMASDTTHLPALIDYVQHDRAQYYYHEFDQLKFMVEYKLQGDSLIDINRIHFD